MGNERSSFGGGWDRDFYDPLECIEHILVGMIEKLVGISTSRVKRDTFWWPRSTVSRKQIEHLHQGIAVDLIGSGNSSNNIDSGMIFKGEFGSSIHKAAFHNDFPSLGTEQRQLIFEIARVSSPKSPSVVGSSSTDSLHVPLKVSTLVSGAPIVTSGLNMAVALVQVLSQVCISSQLSINTQRREELAIKQSRQLILVTPSMPNDSVLNPDDTSKVKPILRTSEVNMDVKNGQQQSSFIHNGNQSPNSRHVKFDFSKTLDKLLVLKSG
ncbi:hypothetical protein V6N13_059152 [Hibiscus sabdariffa]